MSWHKRMWYEYGLELSFCFCFCRHFFLHEILRRWHDLNCKKYRLTTQYIIFHSLYYIVHVPCDIFLILAAKTNHIRESISYQKRKVKINFPNPNQVSFIKDFRFISDIRRRVPLCDINFPYVGWKIIFSRPSCPPIKWNVFYEWSLMTSGA